MNIKNRFINADNSNLRSRKRIKDIGITIPKIRAEFYVRLYSLLENNPVIDDEGYEFFIKDLQTGKEFSAGLTGFGPGYFAQEESEEMKGLINEFHEDLFKKLVNLKECQIEIEHDFGKSTFGFKNGQFIEIDSEEE